jgi:hypothetical protein
MVKPSCSRKARRFCPPENMFRPPQPKPHSIPPRRKAQPFRSGFVTYRKIYFRLAPAPPLSLKRSLRGFRPRTHAHGFAEAGKNGTRKAWDSERGRMLEREQPLPQAKSHDLSGQADCAWTRFEKPGSTAGSVLPGTDATGTWHGVRREAPARPGAPSLSRVLTADQDPKNQGFRISEKSAVLSLFRRFLLFISPVFIQPRLIPPAGPSAVRPLLRPEAH